MVGAGAISTFRDRQNQRADPREINVHGLCRSSSRQQTTLPQHAPVAGNDEFDASLFSRAVIHANLRDESSGAPGEVDA